MHTGVTRPNCPTRAHQSQLSFCLLQEKRAQRFWLFSFSLSLPLVLLTFFTTRAHGEEKAKTWKDFQTDPNARQRQGPKNRHFQNEQKSRSCAWLALLSFPAVILCCHRNLTCLLGEWSPVFMAGPVLSTWRSPPRRVRRNSAAQTGMGATVGSRVKT